MEVLKSELLRIQELRLSNGELAYGSTILISIAPFLVLLLFNVDNSAKHKNILRLALSFASGGLLGDAFLHLIPHSMGHHHHHHQHEHHHEDHNHQHQNENEPHHHHHHDDDHHEEAHHHDHHAQTIVGLCIIMGIILFFIIQKFVHIVKGESHQHHHHHHHQSKQQQQQLKKKDKQSDSDELETSHDDQPPPQQSSLKHRKNKITRKIKSKQHDSGVIPTRLVSGILNLIADFLHNFTDGLAIGATFAAGQGMGGITVVTILLHEIPHEIGDYAILIQAGYRRRYAILLQLVTATGALIGTAVGLHYGTLEHATQFILPITAGGFIYIATVTIIPELLEKANNHMQSFWEIFAILTGVAMMYFIASNE